MNQNRVILFTGTNPESYKDLGRIIHHPMIAISKARLDESQLNQLKGSFSDVDIILLTSKFSVQYFFEISREAGIETKAMENKDMVVIGQNTAGALRDLNMKPKLIAERETSQGLFQALCDSYQLSDQYFLFPRSSLPNPYLVTELTKKGCRVDVLTVYENTKPPKRPLPEEQINSIFYSSPSTVNNFLEDYETIPKNWQILSKGPLTQQTLEKAGYESEIIKDA